jgi:phosphoglycolate phosphatase-like HAD superfamily hydrolase
MPKLVFFDIDGTLVLTGGAGLRAMNRACHDLIGHEEVLAGIPVAGRTDWIILQDALARVGRSLDPGLFAQLRETYVSHLRDEILEAGKGFNGALPGVPALLEALAPREDVFLGLVTGNFQASAQIKLERYDLWRYFRCGAYGDDSSDRNALVPVAIERAGDCGLAAVAPADVLVIGDTPHDVACARAARATPVGVATGGFTADELRACGAEIVFDTFGDTGDVLTRLGLAR